MEGTDIVAARQAHSALKTGAKRKIGSARSTKHATADANAAKLIVHLKSARKSTLKSKKKALASLVEAGIATKKGNLRKTFS